jgi:hypothetical protein
MEEVVVKEFVPIKNIENANIKFYRENGYTLIGKYWYSENKKTRFCNLSVSDHSAKRYSSHDQNGDCYWCPDCDDMQVG